MRYCIIPIAAAKADSSVRRNTIFVCPASEGRPGDRNGRRPARSERRFRNFIATSLHRLLRRPLESAQYTSEQLQRLIADNGVICSMNRSGNVWDNAAMESLFSSLKTEQPPAKPIEHAIRPELMCSTTSSASTTAHQNTHLAM